MPAHRDIDIIHYDETESGPRLRKTLVEKHGIDCRLVQENIGSGDLPASQADIDLYTYVRPSDGQTMWFIEQCCYIPPDVLIYYSWLMTVRPTEEQILSLVGQKWSPEVSDARYNRVHGLDDTP